MLEVFARCGFGDDPKVRFLLVSSLQVGGKDTVPGWAFRPLVGVEWFLGGDPAGRRNPPPQQRDRLTRVHGVR